MAERPCSLHRSHHRNLHRHWYLQIRAAEAPRQLFHRLLHLRGRTKSLSATALANPRHHCQPQPTELAGNKEEGNAGQQGDPWGIKVELNEHSRFDGVVSQVDHQEDHQELQQEVREVVKEELNALEHQRSWGKRRQEAARPQNGMKRLTSSRICCMTHLRQTFIGTGAK